MTNRVSVGFLFLIIVLLGLAHVDPVSCSCVAYDGELCGALYAGKQVSTEGGLPVTVVEELMLVEGYQNFTLVSQAVDPVCYEAGVNYFCTVAMTLCINGTGKGKKKREKDGEIGV